MKVLVTGASGQLGSYLLKEFDEESVTAIDVCYPGDNELRREINLADIRSKEVFRLCEGKDAVIHLAAQVSVARSIEDPVTDCEINVDGTVNMLQASVKGGVRLFIYVSTAAVYGDPLYLPINEDHPTRPKSFYGVSKLSGEFYVRTFGECTGLRYIIIRPFNIYSPKADPESPYSGVITRFVELAKSGLPLTVEGDGEQTRDFIHARDVARMIRLCLHSDLEGEILNCGSGRGTSINELAEIISKSCSKDVPIKYVAPRPGDIRHSVGDISRARKKLGFRPLINLKEGIAEFFT